MTGDPVRLCLRACCSDYGEVCCTEYYGYSGAYDSAHVATGGQKKRAYSRAVVATYGQVRTAADTRVVVLQSGVYDGTHVCATAATVGQVYSYVRTAIAMDGRVRLTADE